jgi:enoyl-CoA hydratase
VVSKRVGEVSVVRLDDGRVNALDVPTVARLREQLADAARTSSCVVSAGLDRAVMLGADRAGRSRLLRAVTGLYEEVLNLSVPTVAAGTGHAVAAGALLLLCCDYRVTAAGDARIGLTEVAVGVPLFPLAVAVARVRLASQHLATALLQGRTYRPDEAAAVGYVDAVCPAAELPEHALAAARRLGGLDRAAFLASRRLLWAPAWDEVNRARAHDQPPAPG